MPYIYWCPKPSHAKDSWLWASNFIGKKCQLGKFRKNSFLVLGFACVLWRQKWSEIIQKMIVDKSKFLIIPVFTVSAIFEGRVQAAVSRSSCNLSQYPKFDNHSSVVKCFRLSRVLRSYASSIPFVCSSWTRRDGPWGARAANEGALQNCMSKAGCDAGYLFLAPSD